MLARQIFSDGHSYHHFYNDGKGETTKHCDDPLWFLLAVTDYIKETGDYDILKSIEPFADGNAGTILDHMFAVYGFANRNLAKHGLPIFGREIGMIRLIILAVMKGEKAFGAVCSTPLCLIILLSFFTKLMRLSR